MPLSSFFRGASAIAGHSRSSSQPLNTSGASFDHPSTSSPSTNGPLAATSSTTADSDDGAGAPASGHVRSQSHTISNSTSFSSSSPGSAAMPSFLSPAGSPAPPPHHQPTMDIYAAAEADEADVPLGWDPALVRRSHTLSTGSGSRLARLEKRQALSNMAEEDRRFFGDDSAGPSPVDPMPGAGGRLPQIGESSPRMAQSGFQVVRAYKDSDTDGAAEGSSMAGGPALYSQATVQRNVSHPTRLQSPGPSAQGQSRTWGPSAGRGMAGPKIVKSDSLRRRMAGMTEGAADRSGNWRVKEEATEDQEEPQSSSLPSDNGFLSPGANLHRAASERTPGAGHHRSFSDLDPSVDPVRRHTSLRAGGRWGASPALPSEIFPGGSSGGSSGSMSPTVDAPEAIIRRGSVGRRPAAGLAASGVPARDNSPRSPVAVPGFGSGPWSPTAEEVIKLREPTAAMLRRSGSGDHLSNPVSRVSPPRRARASDEAVPVEDDGPDLEKLQSAFARMEATNPTEPNVDVVGAAARVTGPGTPLTAKPRVPLPPLVTNFATPPRTSSKPLSFFGNPGGPQSAAPYVPQIGHSARQPNGADPEAFRSEALARLGQTAVPGAGSSLWRSQKETFAGTVVGQQTSPGGPLDWSAGAPGMAATPMSGLEQQLHQQMLINQQLQQLQQLQQQQQILQQQQAQLLSQSQPFSPHPPQQQLANGGGEHFGLGPPFQRSFGAPPPSTGFYAPPANGQPIFPSSAPQPPTLSAPQPAHPQASQQRLNALAQLKGYNQPHFDIRPATARFFVIKSYGEADVHKSLKYEIWASTDLGNKRLDKAFKESAETGPIYLFFSVNASGHFCGMAQMLTAVDYNTNSTVWAQDKWKGVFSVRWIFVKDVPNAALRHIRLNNTPENKPVTSSRDTQEVPYQEGLAIMQILSSYQSRTTLLQDFDWYDQNESNRRGSGDQAVPATPSPNPPAGATLEPPPSLPQRGHSPHKTVSPSRFAPSPQHTNPMSSSSAAAMAASPQYPTAQPVVPIRRFQQQQV